MSRLIYSQEGEVVYKLTDVDADVTNSELEALYAERLTAHEMEMFSDLVVEGQGAHATDVTWCEFIKHITIDEYCNDFRTWCDNQRHDQNSYE